HSERFPYTTLSRSGAGAEDDHAALLEVAHGPQRDVRLSDLAHLDRGLHAGGDAALLEEVLQGEAVHDGAEHAHVVGAAAVHAALGELRAAEEVATADDDRALHALGHPLRDLSRDAGDDIGVDADGASAEGLARELQEDS